MLATRSDEKTWWGPWAAVWFKTHVGLEGLADSAFVFESMVIPDNLRQVALSPAESRALLRELAGAA
ncbi:hypothetical protein OG559_20200 [Micromonospora sp. NBC_01405]|uniref:hypothetical protein n=1 Tax=Micromonospora sp. NBC_01405 TaxID=2903589 RepID=UPI00324A645E